MGAQVSGADVADVAGSVVHRVHRASGDIIESVQNSAFMRRQSMRGSTTLPEESARSKYGPKEPDRQWERGKARISARLSFAALHQKFAPPGEVPTITEAGADEAAANAAEEPEECEYSDTEEHEFQTAIQAEANEDGESASA